MNLQVMEALGIKKAFVLGTNQGGWITVRMALLAPDKIEGIIPLGTSRITNRNAPGSLAAGMAWLVALVLLINGLRLKPPQISNPMLIIAIP
jgi:pimeloyl-ACP methyl ester carboxylesterase